MQSLWRKDTRVTNLTKINKSIKDFIFPSGRQAIMHTLRNMNRVDRVAVAEYSSQCVLNSVASYAMPIPIKEVIKYNINIDNIMIFEQWGWSFSSAVVDEVLDKYKRVIFDCVDSPDAHIRYGSMQSVIVSLSKCLGLRGGALLLEDKILQKNTCVTSSHLGIDLNNPVNTHMINSYINTIDHIGDLSEIDVLLELKREAEIRNKNLVLFANSPLSESWSDWMYSSIDNCSAGIVPLFKGISLDKMTAINKEIKRKLNIESVIYNFNWSGSPLILDYQSCIAFPIHSDIDNIEESIKTLENIKM
jgi:hypothetical protein